MYLNTKTALADLIQQGFQGKAVELLHEYPHVAILERERAMIEEKLKIVTGPLYDGEAEALIFKPLLRAVRAATKSSGDDAMVARSAYQLAASYALIHDLSKISQSKDIAKEITISTMQSQPIVAAFSARIAERGGDDLVNMKEDKNQPPRPTRIWSAVTQILNDGLVVRPAQDADKDAAKRTTTPLSLLYNATLPSLKIDSIESGLVDSWRLLLSNLRHGKGTPLDRSGRKVHMAEMAELLMRIDMLIELAVSAEKSGQDSINSTCFVEAYTAMYWLLLYLNAIAEYDVIFPSSDIMVQSQAWVLIIKTQSAKLKKMFIDIAQVAMSFDIHTAIKLWDEVYRFYDPILNHSLSAVSDMNSLWGEVRAKAEKMLSSFAKDQVDSLFANFKGYMEADYLLPEKDFEVASEVLRQYKTPIPVSEKVNGTERKFYLAKGGSAVFTASDSAGEAPVDINDRYMLVPQLANAASAIEEALSYVKRAREVLQIVEETDDIYHALLPSGVKWDNPYALVGTIKDMREADFSRTDPMQLTYEKYVVSTETSRAGNMVGSLDWQFSPLLMRPYYRIQQLQEFTRNRSNASRILWPGMGELPMGDVISAQYIAQPIPACYTASRNSNFVSNDMKAYMTLMSGRSGVTSASRDMFRKIAAILSNYRDTYARGILDALAATMFVYELKDNKWVVMKPSCPTIYGMPLQAMIEANSWDGKAKEGEATASRYERITLDDGKVFAFVLHTQMPNPDKFLYFAYPYTRGAYLHLPLLSYIFNDKAAELGKALGVSFDNTTTGEHDDQDVDKLVNKISSLGLRDIKDPKFISVLGWAPYLINLPHFLCSYQDEPDVLFDEEYLKYALLSVRVRYDNVERAIYVGGFIENPVEVLDMDDYYKAANESDPTPIIGGSTTQAPDAEPEGHEAKRSEAEDAPDPATLGAQPKDDKNQEVKTKELERVATVTQAPVVDRAAVVQPKPGAEEPKTGLSKSDADALAGEPGPKADPESPDGAQPAGKDRYWKKVSASGEIEEVIKADDCPDGYVPASEQEYRDFVIKQQMAEIDAK